MKAMFLAALAVGAVALSAQAAPSPAGPQASIPFVNHNGIRDWQAPNADTLYIQDNSRNWYRATLFSGCNELPFAQAIGFKTGPIDTFDRFSSVVVRGRQCSVQSLERSDAPPTKIKKQRS